MKKILSNFVFSKWVSEDLAKNFLFFALVVLCAYQVGIGLFKTLSEFSLGGIVRNMLPTIFVGILLSFILTFEDLGFLRAFLQKPGVTIKQVIPIGLSALFLGIVILNFGERGLTEFMVILAVIMAFFLSLYFMLSGKGFYAVVIFLLAFPFVSLVEYWLRYIPLRFEWGPVTLTPTIAFLLILFFLTLIHRQRENSKPSMPVSLKWVIVSFLLVSFFSAILSINPLKSLRAFYLEYACPLILFFIILRNLHEEKQVKILAYSIVASGVLISFICLYFFGRHFGISNISAIDVTLLSTNIDAGNWMIVVTLVLPITIVLHILSNSRKLKMILLGAIGFLFLCMAISFQRTTLLSTPVLLATLAVAKKSRRVIFIILIMFTISLMFYTPGLEFIMCHFQIHDLERIYLDTSLMHRINAWRAALKMIKEHPLGIGTGLWEEYIPSYGTRQPVLAVSDRTVWGYIEDPHNYYIEIAINSGLPGFIVWVYLLILIFRSGVYTLFISRGDTRYYLTLGSISGLLGFLTWCFLGAGFSNDVFLGIGFYFWVLVVLIIKLRNYEEKVHTI